MEQINLEEVAAFAALLYTPERVAMALELDYDEVEAAMMDRNHPFFRAYWKGYLSAEAPIRASIIKLAKNGSSPAQTLTVKMMEQNEIRRDL